jgi:excisionase family DNA binding protein
MPSGGEHTTIYLRLEGRRHPTVLEVPVVDAPDLLTLPQVAARLQVSRWTVYQLIWAGELPSIHLGRCHRVRVRDCEAYVARLGGGEST